MSQKVKCVICNEVVDKQYSFLYVFYRGPGFVCLNCLHELEQDELAQTACIQRTQMIGMSQYG